ncbi:DoxX family protein [Desulfitobacterium sp.]|uniref:DoxX family protein n=1 Tax=Desulfitobacterium sp. TaxID=49981 RepID=UPI002C76E163|nr:DoxX family protein [Desulfitobacterium sp.]HVJ50077.1 DoxX family protein [Desulfitobacterium sp.]
MSDYISEVKAQLKNWKVALLVIVFTVARIIYGYNWIKAGVHKLAWLTDGKLNSKGLISGMVGNLAGAANDPLGINNFYGWVANNLFVNMMPGLTDIMVVIFEIGIGVVAILGFKVFWGALVAIFMNLQFMAAGSFNNFGYIWTDLALLKFAKYAELIGLSGYLNFKKNKKLV